MTFDAVLSLHANPLTCGTRKFNDQLAQKLGVPSAMLHEIHQFKYPLVSMNFRERYDLCPGRGVKTNHPYALLAHFAPRDYPLDSYWVQYAKEVFYADQLGCPPTITGDATRGPYRVLTYGMAHKLARPHFEALKTQLEREHPDYTIELSTAVHEGNPWDEALLASTDMMREIFGDKLRVLGFLMDDALAKVLQECDAVACYFTPAFRANNTTAWAAIAAGKTLYTNRDELSPPEGTPPPTWDGLLQQLGAHVAV